VFLDEPYPDGCGMSTPELPVLACPWCGYGIGLAAFAPADEEPGAVVAVCRGCHRRVVHLPPADPHDG